MAYSLPPVNTKKTLFCIFIVSPLGACIIGFSTTHKQGMNMVRDRNYEQEADKWGRLHRMRDHKRVDADKEAAELDRPGSEVLSKANLARDDAIKTLKESGYVSALMQHIKVQKYPSWHVATVELKLLPEKPIPVNEQGHAETLKPYYTDDLRVLGVGRVAIRNGIATFTEPQKLITALENHGFELSGALAEKRAEILDASKGSGKAR